MSVQFPEKAIFICDGSKCGRHKDVRKHIKEAIKQGTSKGTVEMFKMECSDRCKHAPVMFVQPSNSWHCDVTLNDTEKIISELLS